jgi:hypothetical protein
MKQAAHMVLLGWLLLAPLKGDRRIDDAPLSNWLQVGAYDTAKECEDAKHGLTRIQREPETLSAMLSARCAPSEVLAPAPPLPSTVRSR